MSSRAGVMSEVIKDFPYSSNMEHYHLQGTEPVRVRCMDDRFAALWHRFHEAHGWSHKDPITVPGGIAAVGSNDPVDADEKKVILGWIRGALELHGSKYVIVSVHSGGCGAYKLKGLSFASPEAERKRVELDLRAAVEFLRGELPQDVTILGYLADGEGLHQLIAA